MPTLEFLPMLGLIAVLWLGGRRVISGELSLGSFLAFNAYIVYLVWPLRVLGQRVTTLQKAVAASCAHRRGARRASRSSRSAPPGGARPARAAATSDSRRCSSATRVTMRCWTASTSTSAGPVARARRGDRLREEHRRGPPRAALRPRRRNRAARRPRRPRPAALRRAWRRRARLRRDVPVHGHRAGEHPLRASGGGRPRRSSAPRELAGAHEFIERPAGRLRHGARRARLLALRRAAAASRDRPRDPRRPGRARPRRRDVGGRRDEGARDPRRARRR